MIVYLIVGLTKKTQCNSIAYSSYCFPKLYEPFGGDINVKVDLYHYTTKTGIKNISYIDTSYFALKSNLAG